MFPDELVQYHTQPCVFGWSGRRSVFLPGLDDDLLVPIMLPDADEYPLEYFINQVLQADGSEFCVGRADGDLSHGRPAPAVNSGFLPPHPGFIPHSCATQRSPKPAPRCSPKRAPHDSSKSVPRHRENMDVQNGQNFPTFWISLLLSYPAPQSTRSPVTLPPSSPGGPANANGLLRARCPATRAGAPGSSVVSPGSSSVVYPDSTAVTWAATTSLDFPQVIFFWGAMSGRSGHPGFPQHGQQDWLPQASSGLLATTQQPLHAPRLHAPKSRWPFQAPYLLALVSRQRWPFQDPQLLAPVSRHQRPFQAPSLLTPT